MTEAPIVHEDKDLVILLDLNYTLVGNSPLKKTQKMPYHDKIPFEEYRGWLLDLIRGHTVLLCTVRHKKFQAITLATIRDKLDGWQPEEAFFNATDVWQGNVVKKDYLNDLIIPKYGQPEDRRYYAVESSKDARAMYGTFRIPADAVPRNPRVGPWKELPYHTSRKTIDRWRRA